MRLIRAHRIFGVRLLRCSAWHYWRHNVVESETSKDKLIVCKRSSSRRSSWRSCVRLQIILYIILILWAQTQGLDVSTFVVLAQHVNKYWLFLPRWTVVMNCFHGDKPRPLSGTSSTNEPHKMTWRASCLTPVSCTKENGFLFCWIAVFYVTVVDWYGKNWTKRNTFALECSASWSHYVVLVCLLLEPIQPERWYLCLYIYMHMSIMNPSCVASLSWTDLHQRSRRQAFL